MGNFSTEPATLWTLDKKIHWEFDYNGVKGPENNYAVNSVKACYGWDKKIHTIRGSYDHWAHVAEEVNAGRGVLSLRQWTGKPYNSKQEEFLRLEKMGVQKISIGSSLWVDGEERDDIVNLASHDGLSQEDFDAWFKKPLINGAIIHFTDHRY